MTRQREVFGTQQGRALSSPSRAPAALPPSPSALAVFSIPRYVSADVEIAMQMARDCSKPARRRRNRAVIQQPQAQPLQPWQAHTKRVEPDAEGRQSRRRLEARRNRLNAMHKCYSAVHLPRYDRGRQAPRYSARVYLPRVPPQPIVGKIQLSEAVIGPDHRPERSCHGVVEPTHNGRGAAELLAPRGRRLARTRRN